PANRAPSRRPRPSRRARPRLQKNAPPRGKRAFAPGPRSGTGPHTRALRPSTRQRPAHSNAPIQSYFTVRSGRAGAATPSEEESDSAEKRIRICADGIIVDDLLVGRLEHDLR